MTFSTLVRDRKSIPCNLCGGLMVWQDDLTYKCVDCRKVAKVVDLGNADNELVLEIDDDGL